MWTLLKKKKFALQNPIVCVYYFILPICRVFLEKKYDKHDLAVCSPLTAIKWDTSSVCMASAFVCQVHPHSINHDYAECLFSAILPVCRLPDKIHRTNMSALSNLTYSGSDWSHHFAKQRWDLFMIIRTHISALVLSAHGCLPEKSHKWGFSCTI